MLMLVGNELRDTLYYSNTFDLCLEEILDPSLSPVPMVDPARAKAFFREHWSVEKLLSKPVGRSPEMLRLNKDDAEHILKDFEQIQAGIVGRN